MHWGLITDPLQKAFLTDKPAAIKHGLEAIALGTADYILTTPFPQNIGFATTLGVTYFVLSTLRYPTRRDWKQYFKKKDVSVQAKTPQTQPLTNLACGALAAGMSYATLGSEFQNVFSSVLTSQPDLFITHPGLRAIGGHFLMQLPVFYKGFSLLASLADKRIASNLYNPKQIVKEAISYTDTTGSPTSTKHLEQLVEDGMKGSEFTLLRKQLCHQQLEEALGTLVERKKHTRPLFSQNYNFIVANTFLAQEKHDVRSPVHSFAHAVLFNVEDAIQHHYATKALKQAQQENDLTTKVALASYFEHHDKKTQQELWKEITTQLFKQPHLSKKLLGKGAQGEVSFFRTSKTNDPYRHTFVVKTQPNSSVEALCKEQELTQDLAEQFFEDDHLQFMPILYANEYEGVPFSILQRSEESLLSQTIDFYAGTKPELILPLLRHVEAQRQRAVHTFNNLPCHIPLLDLCEKYIKKNPLQQLSCYDRKLSFRRVELLQEYGSYSLAPILDMHADNLFVHSPTTKSNWPLRKFDTALKGKATQMFDIVNELDYLHHTLPSHTYQQLVEEFLEPFHRNLSIYQVDVLRGATLCAKRDSFLNAWSTIDTKHLQRRKPFLHHCYQQLGQLATRYPQHSSYFRKEQEQTQQLASHLRTLESSGVK